MYEFANTLCCRFALLTAPPSLHEREYHVFPPSRALQVRIITPPESHRRGAQLSLCLSLPVRDVASRLAEEGVIVDVREPHVLRVAPVPLYNTAGEVAEFVAVLRAIVSDVRKRAMGST